MSEGNAGLLLSPRQAPAHGRVRIKGEGWCHDLTSCFHMHFFRPLLSDPSYMRMVSHPLLRVIPYSLTPLDLVPFSRWDVGSCPEWLARQQARRARGPAGFAPPHALKTSARLALSTSERHSLGRRYQHVDCAI